MITQVLSSAGSARSRAQISGPLRLGQRPVDDHDVGTIGLSAFETLQAVALGGDRVAVEAELEPDEGGDVGVVVDYEDLCHGFVVPIRPFRVVAG